MKKFLPFIMLLALLIGQACEGPDGPAGPPGPQGDPGPAGATGPAGTPGTSVSGTLFDFQHTFTAANEYSFGMEFAPEDITVGEGDGVLVYTIYGGYKNLPIWSPLPQQYVFQGNSVNYNYAYNHLALFIFIEAAEAVLPTLGDEFLKDQAFRVVIIPGQKKLRTSGGVQKFNPKDYPVDFSNYQEVISYFKLSDKQVRKVKLR